MSALLRFFAAIDATPHSIVWLAIVLSVMGACWAWERKRTHEEDGPPDVHGDMPNVPEEARR